MPYDASLDRVLFEISREHSLSTDVTYIQRQFMNNPGYRIFETEHPYFMSCTIVHLRYSSARSYASEGGLIEVITDWI